MSIPICRVNATIYDQNGSAAKDAEVTATLNRPDFYQGIVVPERVTAQATREGELELYLFPNSLGSEDTYYNIVVRQGARRVLETTARVPHKSVVDLYSIIDTDAAPPSFPMPIPDGEGISDHPAQAGDSDIPTCVVTATVYDQDGEPAAGAEVTATLSSTDRYHGLIVPKRMSAETGADGQASLALFPNELGSAGTYYDVTVRLGYRRVIDSIAVVPDASTADLYSILDLVPPKSKSEAETAMLAAQKAAAQAKASEESADEDATSAAASASSAEANATIATDAAHHASDSANAAHDDVLSVKGAVDTATQAATDASNSEAHAATSAGKAADSASSASDSATSASAAAAAADASATHAQSHAQDAIDADNSAVSAEQNAQDAASAAARSESAAKKSADSAASAQADTDANAQLAAEHASDAYKSEQAAQTAEQGAKSAEAEAQTIFDNFHHTYLGAFATAPTKDDDGNPLTGGELYFNTTDSRLYFYTGTKWLEPDKSAANSALAAANARDAAVDAEDAAKASASQTADYATDASDSADKANVSAGDASDSADRASNFATAASHSADDAATSASDASGDEVKAASHAADAQTRANAAASSASAAGHSESQAKTSASSAADSASAAATSATNASNSASAAKTSETNAAASADTAQGVLGKFDDRYLGAFDSAPTHDSTGGPLSPGSLYWNTTDHHFYVYDEGVWKNAAFDVEGALFKKNNLSDVESVSESRSNLGLGSAATKNASAFATSAQGDLADGAAQKSNLAAVAFSAAYSDLKGRPALSPVATSGTYSSLSGTANSIGTDEVKVSGRGSVGQALSSDGAGGFKWGGGGIQSGTRMVFYQANAPSGWSQVTSINDRVLRVVSGDGGTTGGNWTISGLSVQGHTLDANQIPKHAHNFNASGNTSNNGAHSHNGNTNTAGKHIHNLQAGGVHSNTTHSLDTGLVNRSNNRNVWMENAGSHSHNITTSNNGAHSHNVSVSGGTSNYGNSGSHSHGISQNGDWRPSYVNVIVCEKN